MLDLSLHHAVGVVVENLRFDGLLAHQVQCLKCTTSQATPRLLTQFNEFIRNSLRAPSRVHGKSPFSTIKLVTSVSIVHRMNPMSED
jgi:hypothetical protein